MNGWVFGLAAGWAVGAVAVCAFLAVGRRRRDRQAAHRATALQARRQAASWGKQHQNPNRPRTARQTPAWARTDHHNGRHRR
ncbi:hypothetical protein ACFWTC_03085 [Streptomyces sp. NPDC058619]|uniref:hypothetical protein n=1 Tax=unclassified Streptomyces TaxID=2593676 RepID=UPI0036500797